MNIKTAMTDLADLFVDIQNSRHGYLQAATGKNFEERIAHTIDRLGYLRIMPTDLPTLRDIKEQVKLTINAGFVNNATDYQRHYIVQPFGSQDYPDFLIMDGEKIISIEAKYSQISQSKPMWNSGLPRLNGIYIFGASGLADITFFRGGDILTADEIGKLHQFFADLKTSQNQFNTGEMGMQAYGFGVYVRKAFDQNRRHSQHAIIDFFNNPNRQHLEAEVIRHVQSQEN